MDTEKWQAVKVDEQTLNVEKICFEMMIVNIDYQIKWHEALLEEIDTCIELESQVAKIIKKKLIFQRLTKMKLMLRFQVKRILSYLKKRDSK